MLLKAMWSNHHKSSRTDFRTISVTALVWSTLEKMDLSVGTFTEISLLKMFFPRAARRQKK